MSYRKIATIKTPQAFREHQAQLGVELPFDETLSAGGALSQPFTVDGLTLVNRFCILPMEGWDGQPDGRPTERTIRRWQRFGQSGAALIWGGEATAVRPDGRANPNQLIINRQTLPDLIALRETLLAASPVEPVIGLQLTHSGRWCKPTEKMRFEPWIAYDHPYLNRKVGLPLPSNRVLSDDALDQLVEDFIEAAALAHEAGFAFVDVKLCHGYLGHELLSAFERPGRYGGSFENRTRFPRAIIEGIRARVPEMRVGVRLSAFDFVPFRTGDDGVGTAESAAYSWSFGGDGSGQGIDLREPVRLLKMLNGLGVRLFCITAGSPYYVPHIQRPAYYPPSDGYLPPEDPLVGVARQMAVTRALKAACPEAVFVGSAMSALQEWFPHVAQAAVAQGWMDFVGLGRMVLSYPELPVDLLAGRPIQRKQLCRTFSDCTTAPRTGLPSGCYPLDALYKDSPEAQVLAEKKKSIPITKGSTPTAR